MDKLKEKLHIGSRRKSQPDNDISASTGTIEGGCLVCMMLKRVHRVFPDSHARTYAGPYATL